MKRAIVFAALAAVLFGAGAVPAGASPIGSSSPNLEEPFDVVCDGVPLTLIDAPSNDNADFTPAFVTGTGRVLIPFSFDARQSIVLLSPEAVFEGVTYHAGDTVFEGTETSSHGKGRRTDATCTFGGSGTETFPDDNGTVVDVEFVFEGTATVALPGRR